MSDANGRLSQDNLCDENDRASKRLKLDGHSHDEGAHSEEQISGATHQHLRKKVDQLIAEHRPQNEPADPRQKSKLLMNVFIDGVWPKIRNEFHQMTEDLKHFLETSLQKRSIGAEVSGRTKEVASAKTTLERREDHLVKQNMSGFRDLQHIFDEMHDLCGLRIVLQYRDDLVDAKTLIKEAFEARKAPANFDPNREVGRFWRRPWFRAYETQNHRVNLAKENEAVFPQYSGIMFEIQLTTFADNLYNKLAHDLLYKVSPDLLEPKDEMVIDLSHGVALCFELCMRILRDKLNGHAAKGKVGITALGEENSELAAMTETLGGSRQAKEAQSAVDDFKEDLETLPEKRGAIEKLSQLITQQLGELLNKQQRTAEDRACLKDLRSTDPRDDKKRIEDTKGGLLKDSYKWILENDDFRRWRDDDQSRLLWIRGDPGKGKTMLLCGIINELEMLPATNTSYFFCQATDSRINTASAGLRGLIYLLVNQQQSLTSYIRDKYDQAGKQLFEDANAWVALSAIFNEILRDPALSTTYLIIDALDECTDLSRLLDLVVRVSAETPTVKWIVSSRNWPSIKEKLDKNSENISLCLELNDDSISAAVRTYIRYKVDQLAQQKGYDEIPGLKDSVTQYLTSHADDTFLWVALVCQELADISSWAVDEETLAMFPSGLNSLYKRMMDHIGGPDRRKAPLCRNILVALSIAYRPITLDELTSLVEIPPSASRKHKALTEIIGFCGSFLTLRNQTIFFVHQSAKEFLSGEEWEDLCPSGKEMQHHSIFSRSINAMSQILKRDIYSLPHPGTSIEEIEPPNPDPLAPIRYACVYWVDHLGKTPSPSAGDAVDTFLRKHFLHWFEALGLIKSTSKGVHALLNLITLLQEVATESQLQLARDMHRFARSYRSIIEKAPLQAYSALIFSPTRSLIRELFKDEEPDWISRKPRVEENWNACVLTLEVYGACSVSSVAFSPDGRLIASSCYDAVEIWDAESGACLSTLERGASSIAFSPDGGRIVLGSRGSIENWNIESGACHKLSTLEGHIDPGSLVFVSPDSRCIASVSMSREAIEIWDIESGACFLALEDRVTRSAEVVFSPDSRRIASVSMWTEAFKIWDIESGACLLALKGRPARVAFSPDGRRIASGSSRTISIWDIESSITISTFEHKSWIRSLAFSPDGRRIALRSYRTLEIWNIESSILTSTFKLEGHDRPSSTAFSPDGRYIVSGSINVIKIWDTKSSINLLESEGHESLVCSVAFSPDGRRIASGSYDDTVKIWDAEGGICLSTLKGHTDWVNLVVFSPDSRRIASRSYDDTVKIWDAEGGICLSTLKGHTSRVYSVVFSPDGRRIASMLEDKTVKIWDAEGGICLSTLKGHTRWVNSVVFSPDGRRIASGSIDRTVKIWDAESGACLSTFSMNLWEAFHQLRFDPGGLYLYTMTDKISLDTPSTVAISQAPTIVQQSQHGYGISDDGLWITRDSHNLLWIPVDFRPTDNYRGSFDILRQNMVVGCSSGRVWSIKFR